MLVPQAIDYPIYEFLWERPPPSQLRFARKYSSSGRYTGLYSVNFSAVQRLGHWLFRSVKRGGHTFEHWCKNVEEV